MKIGLLILMLVFIAILIGLFILSYKMLTKVRREEQPSKSVEYQLHPKLKAEMEKRKSDK
ncbi:hypothetical protein [Acinetobacter wanghuae]|uniref:hypothetical protein n=1 Tax=Acinetobacter wanghuae TaxID=2662362 RepID=UPI003AF569F1